MKIFLTVALLVAAFAVSEAHFFRSRYGSGCGYRGNTCHLMPSTLFSWASTNPRYASCSPGKTFTQITACVQSCIPTTIAPPTTCTPAPLPAGTIAAGCICNPGTVRLPAAYGGGCAATCPPGFQAAAIPYPINRLTCRSIYGRY